MTMDELDKTTTLSRRNLDVSYLAKALEERAKLVFSDIAGQATNKDGGVVGIGELIHLGRWLHGSVALVRVERAWLLHTPTHVRLHAWVAHHGSAMSAAVVRAVIVSPTFTNKLAKDGEN